MDAKNKVPINDVVQDIYAVIGYNLIDAKKIKLELKANVGVYKSLLDDIWNEILMQLNSEAMISSTCEIWYTEKNIPKEMCEYYIAIRI